MTDQTTSNTRWTPNQRAFGVFVLTVYLLLDLPTLTDPLSWRIVRGLAWMLGLLPGVEMGAIE